MALGQEVGHLQEKVNGHVEFDGASTVSVPCQFTEVDTEAASQLGPWQGCQQTRRFIVG